MSNRPRSSSAHFPIIDSAPKGLNTGPSSPTHPPSYPFLHISSLNVRINSLLVHKKGHFFASVQLRKDDLLLDSLPRNRTEVSTQTRETIHFQHNIFNFDTRSIATHRNAPAGAPAPRPPFLPRSASSISSASMLTDSLKGVELQFVVYQVVPTEDDVHGYTKAIAKGLIPLSSLVSQPGFHLKEENNETKSFTPSNAIIGRLTRQGSTTSSNATDESDSDDFGVSAPVPLLEISPTDYDISSNRSYAGKQSMDHTEAEENEIGTMIISVDIRKRVRRPPCPPSPFHRKIV